MLDLKESASVPKKGDGMDARLLAKLLLRILAVYTVAEGVMQFAALSDIESRVSDPQKELLIVVALSVLMTAVALWFLAPALARWAVGKSTISTGNLPIGAANLQSIGFACIGMLIVVQALPPLVLRIFESATILASRTSNQDPSTLITSAYFYTDLFKLTLGIVLLFGAGFFTRAFRRFREFGLPPASSD
ncbi:MAG TPA: hypothetical protein VGH91_05715 [Gammaproteobacteria bacterium]